MNARKNDNRVFLNVVNASAHSATPHSVTIIDSSPDLITIIDSSPDLIFFTMADGLYDRCNKAFLDFLGVSREQVIRGRLAGGYGSVDKRTGPKNNKVGKRRDY